MAANLPLLQGSSAFASILAKSYSLIDYRTSGNEYERVADLSLNRAETWLNMLHVRIDPNYVAVGDLRVIIWDSNNASGNPSAVGSTVPDQRTIDSHDLSPGEFYFFQPPINVIRVVDGMMVNLGFHLERGFRVQVIDTTTLLPIEDGARIVATYVGILSHP